MCDINIPINYSSIATARDIKTQRSSGGLSVAPFLSMLCSGCLWAMYGVLTEDLPVMLPNVCGALVGAWCTWTYHTNSAQSPTHLYIGAAMLLVLSTFTFVTSNKDILGLIADGVTVLLFASPLSTLGTVCVEKSTAALPFGFSVSIWGNAFFWTAYGYMVSQDPTVYIPNGIGLGLATCQLCLFVVFGFSNGTGRKRRDSIVSFLDAELYHPTQYAD